MSKVLNGLPKLGYRIARRAVGAIPALLGAVVVAFLLMRVLPADPAIFLTSANPNSTIEDVQELRESLGLDKPLPVQLGIYLKDVFSGNLGISHTTGQPVLKDLLQRLPASFELTVVGMLLAVIIGMPLGVLGALRPNSWFDHAVRFICTLGVCIPTFVSGLLLIYIFYVLLPIAPDPTGRIDIFASPPPDITGLLLIDYAVVGDWEGWRTAAGQLVLPAATMAIFVLAPIARTTRSAMLAALGSDFVRTAKSLGLSRTKTVVTYALRNAVLPVITIISLVFSFMLGANVLVEKVFSWPGVGSYALDALAASDYAPVQGFVLIMAAAFVVVNLTVDILYSVADPRVISS